jgi:glycerol-3-phosphate O-acyltransferase
MDHGREVVVPETEGARLGGGDGSSTNGAPPREPVAVTPGAGAQAAGAEPAVPAAPELSAMTGRFGILGRILARLAFHRIRVDPAAVERVRALGRHGSVVYVLHQRSVIDYLMVNVVLLREDLPLPQFASGMSALWCRPVSDILRHLRQRLRRLALYSRQIRDARNQDRCVEFVHEGRPVLVFVGGPHRRRWRRRSREATRDATEYLRGIVHSLGTRSTQVYLVPIAIFRGAGLPKREARPLAPFYIVREMPGELKRLLAYLWNRRQTVMTLGNEIAAGRFIDEHRAAGEEQIVNRLTRELHGFLYNEERVVWGPPLRPRAVVRDAVLSGGEMAELVAALAHERRVPEEKIWKEAESAFEEMAANFDGLYFGVLASIFRVIWERIFSGLEIIGFDKVLTCLRQHPVVLVPCHRSHFDYLILSFIFHERFLSPLHIAAGINLSFWPLGSLFRGAGAFFIRRSFGDNPLYKLVFKNYLTFLIREGYTQEFFIEGGRTRTGKMLTPKLGMLSAVVNAFTLGVRDELYLVPVSIHYGRIVEEEAYRREVVGEEKERESLRGLLRAASVLRQRYGTVYVTFADPISLNDALGNRKDRFLTNAGDPGVEVEKRRFIQKLGFRLLREVNGVAVAGATSVSATALLSAPRAAVRVEDFLRTTALLADLLRSQGVRFTASLERNVGSRFQESLAWLGEHGLVQRVTEADIDILYVPRDKRINLDFYKNNVIHFFLIPALMAQALRRGESVAALEDVVQWWLGLYRWEFPLPERDELVVTLRSWVEYLRAAGAIHDGEAVREHPLLETASGILENFREAYQITARTLTRQRDWPLSQKTLVARIQRAFGAAQLLGETTKPEANSVMTYANALNRFVELGYIEVADDARGGKDRRISPGRTFDELPALSERLRR